MNFSIKKLNYCCLFKGDKMGFLDTNNIFFFPFVLNCFKRQCNSIKISNTYLIGDELIKVSMNFFIRVCPGGFYMNKALLPWRAFYIPLYRTYHVAVQVGFTCRGTVSKAWSQSTTDIQRSAYPMSGGKPIPSQHPRHLSLSLSGGGIVNQIKILSCTNDILPKCWNNEGWAGTLTWCYTHRVTGKKTPRILLCVHALAQNLSLSDETIACVWQPVNQPVHPVSMSV